MKQVVLFAARKSVWNKEPPLPAGPTWTCPSKEAEAEAAGKVLGEEGYVFEYGLPLRAEARDTDSLGSSSTGWISCGFVSATGALDEHAEYGALRPQQGRDGREVRRGPGQDLAPQLRREDSALGDDEADPETRSRTRESRPASCPPRNASRGNVGRFLRPGATASLPEITRWPAGTDHSGNSLRALVKYLNGSRMPTSSSSTSERGSPRLRTRRQADCAHYYLGDFGEGRGSGPSGREPGQGAVVSFSAARMERNEGDSVGVARDGRLCPPVEPRGCSSSSSTGTPFATAWPRRRRLSSSPIRRPRFAVLRSPGLRRSRQRGDEIVSSSTRTRRRRRPTRYSSSTASRLRGDHRLLRPQGEATRSSGSPSPSSPSGWSLRGAAPAAGGGCRRGRPLQRQRGGRNSSSPFILSS